MLQCQMRISEIPVPIQYKFQMIQNGICINSVPIMSSAGKLLRTSYHLCWFFIYLEKHTTISHIAAPLKALPTLDPSLPSVSSGLHLYSNFSGMTFFFHFKISTNRRCIDDKFCNECNVIHWKPICPDLCTSELHCSLKPGTYFVWPCNVCLSIQQSKDFPSHFPMSR